MSFATGTATDSNNLFQIFRTFITTDATLVGLNQNWDELEFIDTDTNTKALYLRGKGLSNTDNIYVNVETFLSGADKYNWSIRGATGHIMGNSFDNQPTANIASTYICLHNTPMNYWFFANGRRFVIVAKVSGSIYESVYAGFILPYDTPAEFPYPLLISASHELSTGRFSDTGNDHTSLDRGVYDFDAFSGKKSNCQLLDPSGTWIHFGTYGSSVGSAFLNYSSDFRTQIDYGAVYPYINSSVGDLESRLSSPSGTYLLNRVILMSWTNFILDNEFKAVYGQLDGVVNLSGTGNAAENDVTEGGNTYRVFQSAFRTTVADYFAIIEA